VADFATDPKPPRAHECGASIKRKDRDRADSLAEARPIGFPAERAAGIQLALVLTSILDHETNQSEHAGGESLLSQDPSPDGESVGPQRFRFATAAGDTGVERDETGAPVRFLSVAPHHPGDRRRPSGVHAAPEILAVAKVEAVRARASRRVRSPGRGRLPTERSSCGPPTTAWPSGAICWTMNLSPLQAPMDLSPCARPSSRSCAPDEAMCLSTGTAPLSTGAASSRGATVPLRSESRPTPRGGPPRRRRRSRRQKVRRDQRSSRTKISWHPAHSISSGDDGRGSRRIGV
jgi:hypothetical protein